VKLYLVQHGLALPESIDPDRALDEKGIVQTQKMGEFLRTQEIKVSSIWHSKKLRALQTAQIIAQYLDNAELLETGDLNPEKPVEPMVKELTKQHKDLLVVGHLPFLQKLCGKLLAGSNKLEMIAFRNSGIVCLEEIDIWKISWIVNPNLYL